MFKPYDKGYRVYRGGDFGIHFCPKCRAALEGDYTKPDRCYTCGWGTFKEPRSRQLIDHH